MTEQVKITVHPIAGIDFRMVHDGVAVTIRYYAKADSATPNGAQFSTKEQAVTVGFTATQAKELADSFQRAAQMIENRPSAQSK
jgi:hypothetical protein